MARQRVSLVMPTDGKAHSIQCHSLRDIRSVKLKAKFHYAVQLASRSATSSRKLDSVMEFGRELVCDLLASKIA